MFLATLLVIGVIATLDVSPALSRQPTARDASQSQISVEDLKSKRALVENAADLDEAAKKNALSLLDQTIGFQEQAAKFRQDAETARRNIQSAPDRVKAIKTQLEKSFDSPETIDELAAKMPLETLEQRASQEELDLQASKKELTDRNEQFDRLNRLLKQAPERMAALNQRMQELQEKIETPVPDSDPAMVSEARRLALLSEREMIREEQAYLELLLSGQDVIYSLITAERDLAAREAMRREATSRAWQQQLQARRQEDAVQAREQAEEAKSKLPVMPLVLQDQFDTNIELSAQLEALSREEAELTRELNFLQSRLNAIDDEYALARDKLELIVVTEAIGQALREQRRTLPSADRFRWDSAQRKLLMSKMQERQIELDRRKRTLADPDASVEEITQSIGFLQDSATEKAQLKSEVRALLSNRRELIEKLLTGYQRSFNTLRNIEVTEQQLVAKAEEFADFLDRHLLWIPSSKPIGSEDFSLILGVLRELVRFYNWQHFFGDALNAFRQKPFRWVVVLLIGTLMVAGRRRARHQLAKAADKVNLQSTESILLTLRALFLTLWLAIGWPLLFGGPAYLISRDPIQGPFTQAVASGLFNAAIAVVILGFFYHVCRSNGLAQVHFGWSEAARRKLQANLRWFMPLAASMEFFIAGTLRAQKLAHGDPVARMAFIISNLATLVFIVLILRRSGGIISTQIEKHPTSLLVRLRLFWLVLGVAVPLTLIGLASTSYFFSALEMRNLIGVTAVTLAVLTILHGLALRWLTLVRRKVALQESMTDEAQQPPPDRQETPAAATPDSPEAVSPSTHDAAKALKQLDTQSRKLLKAVFIIFAALVLWWFWEPLFPAFGILEEVQLWSYTSKVGETVETVPITLADLILAAFLLLATLFAARNLPGFLEVTLLSRFPIDYGARHAFATLTRYAIIAAGTLTVFSIIGLKWSTVQWLVAALGVGIGFGLQEIVANFISGLIVLFERPFRVGDTVTVGDVTGTVNRIRIRATTIMDWDRKELVVPNKDFITGRLINWSLSDTIIRLKIPVGIAYGSDTDRAEEILMKAARENRHILSDPAPSAIFTGFGDNSLNFLLRVFINNIDHWFKVIHQVHRYIDREFRKAGITISFPQRDVHLDAAGPLEVRIVPEQVSKGDDRPQTE